MEKIPICFVRNNWNYYSLATIFASVEDFDFVTPFFINTSDLDNHNFVDGTIFCFSFNSIYYETYKKIILSSLNKLKRKGRYIFIVGGPHTLYNPDKLIKDGFDIVVVGSGEKSIREIILNIKNRKELLSIYKNEVVDLNEFKPFPTKYFYYKPIEINRGCPHKCYFCQTSYLLGDKIIERKVENIVRYIKIAFERNIKDFRFISANAFSYCSSSDSPNIIAIEELLSSIRTVIKDKGRIFFWNLPI